MTREQEQAIERLSLSLEGESLRVDKGDMDDVRVSTRAGRHWRVTEDGTVVPDLLANLAASLG